MTIEIRPAVPSDAAQILAFITELAEYEKARHEVIASVADIERSLFSEGATAHGLICLRDGLPIGFAVFFFSYSTWLGSNCLYLEDLYINPEQRGGGALAEQAALDVHHTSDHFVPGFFVLSQLRDEGQDLRSIAGHGGANLDGHGRALAISKHTY